MQILCAYKFELMPTGEQARNMRRFAGACRFVFNKALALQNENYRNGGSLSAMCRWQSTLRRGAIA